MSWTQKKAVCEALCVRQYLGGQLTDQLELRYHLGSRLRPRQRIELQQ